jgi:hypothetical protein
MRLRVSKLPVRVQPERLRCAATVLSRATGRTYGRFAVTRRHRRSVLVVTVLSALVLSACSGQPSDTRTAESTTHGAEESSAPASRSASGCASGAGSSKPRSTSTPRSTTESTADSEQPDQVWGYEDGDLSDWDEVHSARKKQVRVVDRPVRPGYTYSAAFTAGPDDHTSGVTTTIRGEVRSSVREAGTPTEGDEQWYAWSTYFPSDFRWDGSGGFFIYTQWHQTRNSGSPNVALWVTAGREPHIRLTVRGGLLDDEDLPEYKEEYDLGRLRCGEWLDHRVRIEWSTHHKDGGVTVWINGEQRVDETAATLYDDQSAYFKQGIYAASTTKHEHTIYFTDAVRGSSADSVALNSPSG